MSAGAFELGLFKYSSDMHEIWRILRQGHHTYRQRRMHHVAFSEEATSEPVYRVELVIPLMQNGLHANFAAQNYCLFLCAINGPL